MPGSMIHLLAAHKVDPSAGVLFRIGNIAPDAVSAWKDKEVRHLRNLVDRTEAITNLAINTDKTNEFDEGMLLHLFVDWKWDISFKEEYIKKTGENWFLNYRHELSLASSFAYHHLDWSEGTWREMDICDISRYGIVDGATDAELEDFISRGTQWHRENHIGPSSEFLPDRVETFTEEIAKEYRIWRDWTEEEAQDPRNF